MKQNDAVEQARELAWERFMDEQPPLTTAKHEYDRAFEAGLSVSSLWVKIAKDRLPQRSGIYWVTRTDGKVQRAAFYCGAFNVDAIAWMPDIKPTPFSESTKYDK